MLTSSAKAKGRRLQQQVRDDIISSFSLDPSDVLSTSMGCSGVDLKLSSAAKEKFPFSVECKNQESLSIWACLSQCESNTEPGTMPLLIFKRNHSETYACIRWADLLRLLAVKSGIADKFGAVGKHINTE